MVMSSSFTTFQRNKKANNENADLNFEIVIEGDWLAIMLKPENKNLFGKIIQKSSAILVWRSSPKQKAEVVEFAKSINPKIVSLAIGDGGNDVSMIKAADVGIGIFGKEGYQAVTASDYAIGEFQFLRRLTFIHGRYCVRRISVFILQFLVKNAIISIPALVFAFYSAYSGQTFFEPGYLMVFNAFTSQLAICYFAVYDQDIDSSLKSKQTKLLLPYLYTETRENVKLSLKDFAIWYLYGVYAGVALFYFSYYSYYNAIDSNGDTFGLWQFSFAPYVAIWIINLSIVSIYIQAWSCATLVFYFVHIILFYPGWVFIYNEYPLSDVYKSELDFYSYGLFWLVLLFNVWLIIMPIALVKKIKALFFPSLSDLVLSNKISKEIDIEDKLRIDIVKLEKDLDSDSDESIKLPSEIVTQRKDKGNTSEKNHINSPAEDEESIDSRNQSENNPYSSQFGRTIGLSGSNWDSIDSKSISDVQSSASSNNWILLHPKASRSHHSIKSLRRSNSKAPHFERFTENIQEFKNVKVSMPNSRSQKRFKKKVEKLKKKNHDSNKKLKFHPQFSSVEDNTIQERDEEEDADDISHNKKRFDRELNDRIDSEDEDVDEEGDNESNEEESEENKGDHSGFEISEQQSKSHESQEEAISISKSKRKAKKIKKVRKSVPGVVLNSNFISKSDENSHSGVNKSFE